MKLRRAPEELKTLLDAAMQGIDAEKKIMFGYPAYFLNRNLFIGLYQDQLFMRLPEGVITALRKQTGLPIPNLEPLPGRPLRDYFVIARQICLDRSQLKNLIEASLEHTRTVKPKQPGKTSAGKGSAPTLEKGKSLGRSTV